MQPADSRDARAVPTPAAVAVLPHDPRGYPIPAITPRDAEGLPTFAVTGIARALICAAERRCSICGRTMAPGPVWRVIASAETEALALAQAEGRTVVNRSPSPEPPGHRECMLFAAFTCPFLARPNARRRTDAEMFGESLTRGTARGAVAELGGAVAGFADYEFRYAPGENVAFFFSNLVELRPHLLGAEQVPELAAALEAGEAALRAEAGECPAYLLDDERGAEAQARAILTAAMERNRSSNHAARRADPPTAGVSRPRSSAVRPAGAAAAPPASSAASTAIRACAARSVPVATAPAATRSTAPPPV